MQPWQNVRPGVSGEMTTYYNVLAGLSERPMGLVAACKAGAFASHNARAIVR
jgi:hypothetical protein